MADGKLVFPVKFDLERAVREATGDVDKIMKRLETRINARPLKLTVHIDESEAIKDAKGNIIAATGSIKAMRSEMSGLVEQWNKLSEAERITNQESGKFTDEAQKILSRYMELVTATESYAKGLSQIASESKRAADAELKRVQKANEEFAKLKAAKAQERALRNPNMDNLSQVEAALKYYEKYARAQNQNTRAWNLAIQKVTELKARSEELSNTYKSMTRQDVFSMKEDNLSQVRDKLKALKYELDRCVPDTKAWRDAGEERIRLLEKISEMESKTAEKRKQILDEMHRKEKEHDAAKGERRALAIAEQRRKAAGQLTKEQEKRQRMLNAEENTINNIQKKLEYYRNKLNGQQYGSAGFVKTAKEIERLTIELEKAQRHVNALTDKTVSGAGAQERAYNRVAEQIRKQTTYVERLVQRMMIYASFNALSNLISNIREVTAQFELQRISLGAIIQDQNRANQLFSEIKQFALKSPVSILDMTKYTKQVAAYRIETDKLFDTTKRLADVSVGLGVDMGRIVLAYGQVRAASYLRAAEIRQFTEAGIPILELLSEKLTKLNGELVTTEKVMDLVSKRGIDFKMVEEIFNDMTSAGGMFYNMQEKQGNTLYGMWQKLGDAASIMYSEIGNTGPVDWAMKTLINGLTDVIRNWKAAGLAIATSTVLLSGWMLYNKAEIKGIKLKDLATQKLEAAEERLDSAIKRRIAATQRGVQADIDAANALEKRAQAARDSAIKENQDIQSKSNRGVGFAAFGKSLASMTLWTAAISAVTAFAYKLYESWTNASRLEDKIKEITSETGTLQDQSVRNFERLVNSALKAADGSKAQKDALDELNRTYKDMLPEEALRIENLRSMENGYGSLTQTIREYIAVQQQQREINAINEEKGAVQTGMYRKLRESMMDKDLKSLALSDDEVQRFFQAFRETSLDTSKTLKERFVEAFRLAGLNGAEAMWENVKNVQEDFFNMKGGIFLGFFGSTDEWIEKRSAISAYANSVVDQLNYTNAAMSRSTGLYGEYTDRLMDYHKRVQENLNSGDSFLSSQENNNMRIKEMEYEMRVVLGNVKIKWQKGWSDIVESVDPNNLQKISQLNMEAILSAIDPNKYPTLHEYIENFQKEYYGLVPQNATVQQIRAKLLQISDSFGVSMDKLRMYLWDGSGDVDVYLKRLKEQQEELKARLKEQQTTLLHWSANEAIRTGMTKEQLQSKIEETAQLIKALDQQIPYVTEYTNQKDKDKSSGSDTRLQTLQEINQTLTKINKEYDDLQKKEGRTRALEDIKKQFKDTLDYTNQIGKKFGLHFDFPTEFKNLQQYRDRILQVMKNLKNLKGGEKDILEFQTMIDKAESDEFQKKIENELKRISGELARTKTAKEFFDRILTNTGDVEIAARLSFDIYGETGEELNKRIISEIENTLRAGSKGAALSIATAIREDGSVDYNELVELAKLYQSLGSISDECYEKILKMRDEDRKDIAKTVESWLKAVEKSKSYSDKILDLRRRTQTEIDKITQRERNGELSSTMAESLRNGYLEKEGKELAKLQYEAFKDSPMYVQMFDDLDHASTAMLRNMKTRIEELRGEWKNLDPSQLKEMQTRLNEIDSQMVKRNPFKTLSDSIKDFRRMSKTGDFRGNKSSKEADNDLMKWAAKAREAERVYQDLLQSDTATKEDIAVAKSDLDAAMSNEKAAQKAVEAWKKVKDMIGLSAEELFSMMDWAGGIAKGIADISQAMGADEEDVEYWNSVAGALNDISSGIQDVVKNAMSGNVVGVISSVITAVPKMFVGFSNLFYAGRIKRANKEIKRQQELLDRLEYTYGRLEKAAEKALGSDYLRNLNQRKKTLEAEAAAYKKQAEAEKSKGKKADKDKIKEYENSYRDTMDEIADMYGTLSQQMLGADLTSAARDFAQAWLDAYKEFDNTADAMSDKFKEMIENMLVESALSRVMERALRPMFDMIDNMEESDFYSQDFWGRVVSEAEKGADAANTGAMTMMRFLEQAGIKVRDLGGELTGIKREYANASEESVSGLAAATNTQNYYMSQIDGNVQIIRRILESGTGLAVADTGYTDLTEIQRQSMAHLAAIERNTAETVAECRQIAASCAEQVKTLNKVVDFSGGSGRIRVKM